MFLKRHWVTVLLGLIAAFFLTNNLIWLFLDTLPPSWDQSAHASFCLDYLRIFSSPTRLSFTKILQVSTYWPPFFHLSSVPLLLLFGFSFDAVAATNFIYLVVLVFSVYKIGEYFFNEKVGIGAVLITLFYPMVYALSRDILLDFALLAMVALALFTILMSKGGMDRRWSWLLGVVLAFSLLTKWTALLFVIGPLFAVFIKNWITEKPLRKKAVLALGIAVLVFLVIVLPWYLKNLKEFSKQAETALFVDSSLQRDPTLFFQSMTWYGNALINSLISKPLILFSILGLAGYVLWVRKWEGHLFLLSWILPAFIVFAVIPNKDGRYIVPLLPALGILTSAGLCALPWRGAKRAVWMLLLLTAIIHFYGISFGWPTKIAHNFAYPPLKQDWKVEEILGTLQDSFPDRPVALAVLPNLEYFNPIVFKLYVNMKKLPYQVDEVGYSPLMLDKILQYNVFISKTGRISVRHTSQHRINFRREFRKLQEEMPGKTFPFKLWKTFPLPDQSQATVYLRKKDFRGFR